MIIPRLAGGFPRIKQFYSGTLTFDVYRNTRLRKNPNQARCLLSFVAAVHGSPFKKYRVSYSCPVTKPDGPLYIRTSILWQNQPIKNWEGDFVVHLQKCIETGGKHGIDYTCRGAAIAGW